MMRTHDGPRVALALGLAAVLLTLGPVPGAQAQGAAGQQCFFSGQNVVIESGHKVTCRSLNVLGGDLRIEQGAELDGALAVAGDVTVAGRVTGDAWVAGDLVVKVGGTLDGDASVTGNADIEGTVTGDLKVMGNADIASSATVNAVSAGGDVRRAEGAQVVDTARSGQRAGNPVSLLLLVLFTLLSAGFAGLTTVIARPALERTRSAASGSPLLALVVGVLAWAVTVLLLVPLAFTIVGPVIWLAALGVGTALGWAAFSDGLGTRLWSTGSRPLAAALGGALLALLVMVLLVGGGWLSRAGTGAAGGPVICLGLVLLLGLWTWGLGASLLTLFGSRPWPRAGAATHAGAATTLGQAVPLPAPANADAALVAAGAAAETTSGPDSGAPMVTAAEPPADSSELQAPLWLGAAAVAAVAEDPAAEVADASAAVEDLPVAAEAAVLGAGALAGDADSDGGEPEAVVTPLDEPSAGAASAAAADVRSVAGISPIFGFLLAEGGIRTVGDLAAASPEQVRAALSVPGVVPVDDATVAAWQAAANRQAAGGA